MGGEKGETAQAPLAIQAGGRRGFTTRLSALPWAPDPASSAADPRLAPHLSSNCPPASGDDHAAPHHLLNNLIRFSLQNRLPSSPPLTSPFQSTAPLFSPRLSFPSCSRISPSFHLFQEAQAAQLSPVLLRPRRRVSPHCPCSVLISLQISAAAAGTPSLPALPALPAVAARGRSEGTPSALPSLSTGHQCTHPLNVVRAAPPPPLPAGLSLT